MYHSLFAHSIIEGHFGCSQLLVFMNKAAIDIHGVDISFQLLSANM